MFRLHALLKEYDEAICRRESHKRGPDVSRMVEYEEEAIKRIRDQIQDDMLTSLARALELQT